MRAAEVMSEGVPSVSAGATVFGAAESLVDAQVSACRRASQPPLCRRLRRGTGNLS